MHLTAVDALDTLLLLNLSSHYRSTSAFLSQHLRFGHQNDVNVFETTIRVLGALLSSHALTSDAWPLQAAQSLAQLLLHAFNSPTGVPWGTLSFGNRVAYNPAWAGGASTVSELASIQLEFQYLSRVTGDPRYEDAVDAVMQVVKEAGVDLYPQFMNVQDGALQGGVITLGARVDSLYEYLLKQWLLGGKGDDRRLMRDMWLASGRAIIAELLFVAWGDGTVSPYTTAFVERRGEFPAEARLFVAERLHGELKGKMDHLVCFLPGVFALSAHHRTCALSGGGCNDTEWLAVGRELLQTCVDIYDTRTGLAPEIVQFSMRRRDEVDAEYDTAVSEHRTKAADAARQTAEETRLHSALCEAAHSNASLTDAEREAAVAELNRTHAEVLSGIEGAVPPTPERWRAPAYVVDGGAKYNLLRPETMESLFVLWWVTGEERWREAGWRIFCAFVRYARVDGGGYSGLNDVEEGDEAREREHQEWEAKVRDWLASPAGVEAEVREVEGYAFVWSNWNDHMESFFLSETLKYAALLFSDRGVVSLDRWVFNTEAHPLPVREGRREEEVVGYGKRRAQKAAAVVAAEAAAAAAAATAAAEAAATAAAAAVEAPVQAEPGNETVAGVEERRPDHADDKAGVRALGGAEVVASVDATGVVDTQPSDALPPTNHTPTATT